MKLSPNLTFFVITTALLLSFDAFPQDNLHKETLAIDQNGIQRGTIIMESYTFNPIHLVAHAGIPISIQLSNDSFLVPHNFVIDYSVKNESLLVPKITLHNHVNVSSGETKVINLLVNDVSVMDR